MGSGHHHSALKLLLTAYNFWWLFSGCSGITRRGCFPVGQGTLTGWTEKWDLGGPFVSFCVDHCADNNYVYAGLYRPAATDLQGCRCGQQTDLDALTTAKEPSTFCSDPKHPSMEVFQATADLSLQYRGCYKEDTSSNTSRASIDYFWTDRYIMSPRECLQYCSVNGALFATLQGGEACACSHSFAKHGKVPETECGVRCSDKNVKAMCGGPSAISVYAIYEESHVSDPDTAFIPLKHPKALPASHEFLNDLIKLSKLATDARILTAIDTLSKSMTDGVKVYKDTDNILRYGAEFISDVYDFTQSESKSLMLSPMPAGLKPYVDKVLKSSDFSTKELVPMEQRLKAWYPYRQVVSGASLAAMSANFFKDTLQRDLNELKKLAVDMVVTRDHCLPNLNSVAKAAATKVLEDTAKIVDVDVLGVGGYLRRLDALPSQVKPLANIQAGVDLGSWAGQLEDLRTKWNTEVRSAVEVVDAIGAIKYCIKIPCPLNTTGSFLSAPPMPGSMCEECASWAEVQEGSILQRSGAFSGFQQEATQTMLDFQSHMKTTLDKFDWKKAEDTLSDLSTQLDSADLYIIKLGMSTQPEIMNKASLAGPYNVTQACRQSIPQWVEKVCHQTAELDQVVVSGAPNCSH